MRGLAVAAALLMAGCGSISAGRAQQAHASKVDQALSDYEIARGRGDALDMCVKAKLVALAYEDAGQAANREAWQAREAQACGLAYEMLAGPSEAD